MAEIQQKSYRRLPLPRVLNEPQFLSSGISTSSSDSSEMQSAMSGTEGRSSAFEKTHRVRTSSARQKCICRVDCAGHFAGRPQLCRVIVRNTYRRTHQSQKLVMLKPSGSSAHPGWTAIITILVSMSATSPSCHFTVNGSCFGSIPETRRRVVFKNTFTLLLVTPNCFDESSAFETVFGTGETETC